MVLEGGGMRGLYTAGVLDQLIEWEIEVNGMVTVSAGALFGISFVSKQKGRSLRYNKKYIKDKRYISLRSLIKTGDMVNKEFAYQTLPNELDIFDEEAFKQSNISFYATVTNVETGKPEYVLIEEPSEQMEILRASGSMPFVSNIVEYDGRKYLDGGVSDSIPVEKALSLGYDKMIIILTRPLDYRKKPSKLLMADLKYRRYPEFTAVMKKRYQEYNETVEKIIQLEKEGKAFVFRPSESIPIKRLEKDPNKLQKIYDLGFSDAVKRSSELIEYLKS